MLPALGEADEAVLVTPGQLYPGVDAVADEDPEVAAHLGETLWLMGRTDEARRTWDDALVDHPDSRPLKRAIERHPR